MQCHTAQCIIHINLKTIFSSDTFNACISNTYCLWHCFPPDSVKSFTLFHFLYLFPNAFAISSIRGKQSAKNIL